VSGLTFDAGGLIALDRNDRRVLVLLARAAEVGARVTIPATALAQAMRHPARQARLARLVRPDATSVGVLLAASRTTDVVDAHVVICARRSRQAIVTSDPTDIHRLDPAAQLVIV